MINTDTHVLLWSNVEQALNEILQYVSLSFLLSVKKTSEDTVFVMAYNK
jgi:hypothetical protein